MLRRLIVLLGLIAGFAAPANGLNNSDRYAAFVVDADTGAVMHSRRSEARRYPASLTKMMTLYMLFEAVENGDIALTDPISISANAADEPCSCLGVEAGDTITAETAIRALVIRSANDVAVAVGERLGGGEAAFARQMTERAQRLGLENTTFRNASGLPNSRQVTTAQDMARLAIALRRDFPQFFHYFAETRFSYGGRTYRNHNSLVGRVDGVDGLKTGYIRASGFNVVVSAERHGHRLITVVMGGPSAASRDAHAEELLEAAFDSIERRVDAQFLAALDSPRLNPVRRQDLIAIELAELGVSPPTEMGSAQTAPPLRIELEDASAPETPGDDRADAPATRPSGPGVNGRQRGWAIQVGAYRSEQAALARLESVALIAPGLTRASRAAPSVGDGEDRLWRARFEALSADDARTACAALVDRDEPCYAVAPEG